MSRTRTIPDATAESMLGAAVSAVQSEVCCSTIPVTMNSVLVFLFGLIGAIQADQWKDKVRLTCESTGMKVEIPATEAFKGVMWIEGSGNPACVVRGSGSKAATIMFIPYDGCNTMRASNSLYVNKISFKQRAGLVSSRDSVLEVVCRLKSGHVKVNSEKTVFSIITDGVRDITRTVAKPDEPTLSNVKLLRDNISGKQKFHFGLHLPRSTTFPSQRAPTVRNCKVIQDNVVLSAPEQRVTFKKLQVIKLT
ncbi:uncharacterized protein LOC114828423 [Galendromus occidentalis]|uniref:Uncharacterized protein LOC114828423 n=1 Tax=Galendromus occidentalis TaxID=34638 RepID=A0AAJ7SGS5_9ACAR|nr:uncharacterized protein LOC114828423 [Galendromus occidentalis]